MGTLRTLLAVCVVIAHSGPILGWRPLDGGAAVALFFIVSGFYMSLVLNGKYAGLSDGARTFWYNRILRLWPSYLFALVVTATARPDIVQAIFNDLSGVNLLLAGVMNLLIVGAEFTQVIGIDAFGNLYFSTDNPPLNIGTYVILGQNWALAFEILFYLIAPFVVISRTRVLAVAALAVLMTATIMAYGLSDFWRYRFFPGVLIFFMAGALAYHWGAFLKARNIPDRVIRTIGAWSLIFVLAAVAFPNTVLWFVPEQHYLKALLVVFTVGLPFWLSWTGHRAWDRWIGDLSYPVYLIHLAVIAFVGTHLAGDLRNAVILFLSLVLGAVMVVLIERPVDTIRQRRVRAKHAEAKAT